MIDAEIALARLLAEAKTPREIEAIIDAIEEVKRLRAQITVLQRGESAASSPDRVELARLDYKLATMRHELDGLMEHQAKVHRDLIESLDQKDRAIARKVRALERALAGWDNRLKFGAPVDVIDRERAEIAVLRKEIG